ncbi:MAG TPA: cadherin domain-containing protein, partial [Solimonas sp.]|nr:cadherin domain-containing protein [Solimonas sp.]
MANLIDDQLLGSVAEKSPAGTVVGTVAASGTGLTYSLVGGDTARFAIDALSGQVTVTSNKLNYEGKPLQTLQVRVTDTLGNVDTATIQIQVSDVNEAPDSATGSFTVAENSAVGTVLGTVLARDPDAGDAVTFSITGGNPGGAFAINASTGQLTVANSSALDFETSPSFVLTVTAVDSAGLSSVGTVTVQLTDVVEAVNLAPVFTQPAGYSFTISENMVTGAVGMVKATDPEATAVTYRLEGPGSEHFKVNANGRIGVWSYADIDFEQQSVFSLTLVAADAAGNETSTALTINVNDLNDEVPVFGAPSYSFSVNENATSGVLGSVVAIDTDAADAVLAYSLSGAGASNFVIDASTGAISVAPTAAIDYETQTSYVLTVTATDSASHSSTATVNIAVNNLNDRAPVFQQPGYSFTVNENMVTGAVGLTKAIDPDAGDTVSYRIEGVGSEHFKVNANGRVGVWSYA